MPTTADRTLAAVVYFWILQKAPDLLHPSQALLNTFREPQGNFLDMWEALHTLKKSKDLSFVLFTDLKKAFEYINPEWILLILRARRAPQWIIAFASHTFFGRILRPRIRGKLLPGLEIQTGVDMGSAISPFFFCLAIDPLIRRINSYRNVIVMRAYMDDNSAMLKHAKSVDRIATLFEECCSTFLLLLRATRSPLPA